MPQALPLVTVITPTHNRAHYLPETIESVLNQTYTNVEYIVLDDGSTDNTQEVLSLYDGRITWESHPNMREARTVTKGFSMAQGEFITIVNSDDPVLPEFIEIMVNFMMDHPDIAVAYPDWHYIDGDSQRLEVAQRQDYDYLYMVRECICLPGAGAFIRRNAPELELRRDPSYQYVGDFEFWLRLGLRGQFAHVPQALVLYRLHDDSASLAMRGPVIAEEHIRLYDNYWKREDLPPEVWQIQTESLSAVNYMAGKICLPNAYPEARRYFLKSLRHSMKHYLRHMKRLIYVASVFLLPAVIHKKIYSRWMAQKEPWLK